MATLEFNMVIDLSKKAYKPGDYYLLGNFGSSQIDTGIEPNYANVFDVTLTTKEGTQIPIVIKSVKRSVFNQKNLEFTIESDVTVDGGTLQFKNKNNGLLIGKRRADDIYFKSETLQNVNIQS